MTQLHRILGLVSTAKELVGDWTNRGIGGSQYRLILLTCNVVLFRRKVSIFNAQPSPQIAISEETVFQFTKYNSGAVRTFNAVATLFTANSTATARTRARTKARVRISVRRHHGEKRQVELDEQSAARPAPGRRGVRLFTGQRARKPHGLTAQLKLRF